MATRPQIGAVYAAAVVQGIVLVTFPAVSTVFTNRAEFGLTDTEYGGMFVPQAVTAILASLLGAGITRRVGGKTVFLLGLVADMLSMVLLFCSQFARNEHALAYGTLLAATGSLGIGFGFAVPALNTFTAAFFPQKVDRAILTLNALLGLGTALAPIFATVFVGLGIWWGLPCLMSVLTLALLILTVGLPLPGASPVGSSQEGTPSSMSATKFPPRFWFYAAFALIYGICETLNGNWATVYLSRGLGASATLSSFALTTFWVAVTGGRVLFAALERWLPPRWIYCGLPAVIAIAFILTACVPRTQPLLGIFSFGLAGLGCSALLPLVISFGQEELISLGASVAGGLIGFYQMGYGLAAFGVGPLQAQAGLGLAQIFGGAVLFPIILCAVALAIVRKPRKQLV